MKNIIFIFLFQSSVCMSMQPISEYCEDSNLLSSFAGDTFAATNCLAYGFNAENAYFSKSRNTSIRFDKIKPAIDTFVKIVNTAGGSSFDKQEAFYKYVGEIDSFSVPLFASYDEFEDAKASLVFSVNYTTSCNISVLDYSGGDKFMIGYKLNRMTDEGKYNYDYLHIELPEEAKINKADSDGLIDAFCHNDLSFKRK
ncbi:hypothetical protein [Pseudoalteromonas arabiensis]|uniref:hypothetical protein n=1 Tax=Pseudoalteromonas arabiensis TaxID=874454 RepID=UPI000785D2B0|nr:hypothetical protein [Pseudoalteromonas arabiensis]